MENEWRWRWHHLESVKPGDVTQLCWFLPRISLTFGVEHADIRHLERFHANQTMSAVSSVLLAASEGFLASQHAEMWHETWIQHFFKTILPAQIETTLFSFLDAVFRRSDSPHGALLAYFLFQKVPTSTSLTWLDLARSLRSQHQRTLRRTATGGSRHVWCRLSEKHLGVGKLLEATKRISVGQVELWSECLSCQWDYANKSNFLW